MKLVILTADDFGLDVAVNEAVERAHRDGVLTAASLMVGGGAAADAVERAHRLPSLGVGLHIVLVRGRPVLPPERVPDLVDAAGRFSEDLVRTGFACFLKPAVRRQVKDEVRAQFAAFRATGLVLDHVNAHNHMHLHPTLLAAILEVGQEHGLAAMRVPWEPPLASWRAARRGLAKRMATAAGLAPWTALLRRRLRRAGIRTNRHVFGLHDSGAMDAELVERLAGELDAGVTEIYFHPAAGRSAELDRDMAHYRHEDELAALTSPRVAAALAAAGARRIAFRDLWSDD